MSDTSITALASQWEAILEKLRQTHGDAVFRSWLKPITCGELSNGQIALLCPTRFMRDWVQNHYMDSIRQFWTSENSGVLGVELIVRPAGSQAQVMASEEATVTHIAPQQSAFIPRSSETIEGVDGIPSLERVSSPLDSRYTFDNFIVGKPNELAFAAAKRVAETPHVVAGCNPLFLYGGVGLGKTHLMHAIAWHIRRHTPERRVIYLSAEKFMYQFIRAIRFNQAIAFKELFRSVDVLMVDDVQFISGKDSTQEEFFHTFNALVDQNKQLVISGDRSPSDIDGLEERIKSRLGWGLVADIHPTSYELRLGILQSKVENMRLNVPPKVLEFLAMRITSNIRELEGALNRVTAHATLVGREITLDTVQDLLQDLLRANDRRINIDDIQRMVAGHYNIKVADMHSARRSVAIARPRQVAMYLSKHLTTKSLPEIGRRFGGKDHTTVMHAIKRIDELSSRDTELKEDIDLLTRSLQNR